MADTAPQPPTAGTPAPTPPATDNTPQPVVVQVAPPRSRKWPMRLLGFALIASLLANFGMYSAYRDYFARAEPPQEKYRAGDRTATTKVAVIEIAGTIMPPFTGRWLKMIDRAAEDDDVKAVALVVDSPGGLVADSHQIYHALEKLRETNKPIVVVMKRLAASGGLYVSMGAGPDAKIFAEPTTWTGSIGVIVPHYDLTKLAEEVGIQGTPRELMTGDLKDSLSPLRPLNEKDKEVWKGILDDAFGKFVDVIARNRKGLDEEAVRQLATGQIYTASQAKANGLVDEIGFEEEAFAHLKELAELDEVRFVTYEYPVSLVDLLTFSAKAEAPEAAWRRLMESTVPRAMFYCSWAPFYVGE